MQVTDMPIISEPELELSMGNSNRDKSHSEGSNTHLYEPVQTVLHSVKGQRLGNASTNPPRSSSWSILKKFLKEKEIVRYSNGWNPLSSKSQIKNIREYHAKKERGKQGRSPITFYKQASSQPASPRRQGEQERE
ncbi:hypothetical protein O181_106444 [Austropuccinia psidii MF-1]|uniref:Uncharacterized protein n=1 Tax=Austropuccinia psidii MF-1 TaxID=1389203 RepID=A0A9Q3JRE1_9BASI|nr:hypothetical protein [Austropuccinia psidii MF-1]